MHMAIEKTEGARGGDVPAKAGGFRTRARGFTMVELMTVVVIVGVLATVAIFGVLRYIASAKVSEAMAMVNSIRAAEEAYRDETFRYAGNVAFNDGEYHPVPGNQVGAYKAAWQTNGSSGASRVFRELGVDTNNPVYYTYNVVKGDPGDSLAAPPTTKSFGFPNPLTEPAYCVVAKGDLDGDKKYSYVVSHSFSGEIYVEREGE